MKRRAFLKQSAVGMGTLAGVYAGVLKADGGIWEHSSVRADDLTRKELSQTKEEGRIVWGTNAVLLRAPWERVPAIDEMLADREHSATISQYYRAGGEDRPATPTECLIGYSDDALFIMCRCTEDDMSFPYANLDADLWREANWHSLNGLPSAANNWPPNPDEVDILIQPDTAIPSYYQFAATPQGLKFGCNRELSISTEISADEAAAERHSSARIREVDEFQVAVARRDTEWLVSFQIPWKTLGANQGPNSAFFRCGPGGVMGSSAVRSQLISMKVCPLTC